MKSFIFATLLLYGAERILETFWKRKKVRGRIIAAHTLYLLVSTHLLVYFAAVHAWATWEESLFSRAQFAMGLFIILLALFGRISSIKSLGPYHSIHIEIRSPHPIINSGSYQFVRNPYYVSNALEIIGLPLLTGSSLGLFLGLGLYWPALWLRIISEESALQEANKRAFIEYKLRVPRLMPKLRIGEGTWFWKHRDES